MSTVLFWVRNGTLVALSVLVIGRIGAAILPHASRRIRGTIVWRWGPALLFSAIIGVVVAGLGPLAATQRPSVFLLAAAWVGALLGPWLFEWFWWSFFGPEIARNGIGTTWQMRFLYSAPLYGISILAAFWALQLGAAGK
jgi:hypothetical protein